MCKAQVLLGEKIIDQSEKSEKSFEEKVSNKSHNKPEEKLLVVRFFQHFSNVSR